MTLGALPTGVVACGVVQVSSRYQRRAIRPRTTLPPLPVLAVAKADTASGSLSLSSAMQSIERTSRAAGLVVMLSVDTTRVPVRAAVPAGGVVEKIPLVALFSHGGSPLSKPEAYGSASGGKKAAGSELRAPGVPWSRLSGWVVSRLSARFQVLQAPSRLPSL